jgi:hypothetical protein
MWFFAAAVNSTWWQGILALWSWEQEYASTRAEVVHSLSILQSTWIATVSLSLARYWRSGLVFNLLSNPWYHILHVHKAQWRISSKICSVRLIDYRCDDGKKSWRVKRRHWCHWIGLDSIFHKTPMITPKNELFSQDTHSKLPTFDRGWDLPISKTWCWASGLHVSVK